MLLLYFLLAGVLIGLARGGHLTHLGDARFLWWPVALGGLAFQALLFSEPLGARVGDAGPALYVVSTLAVLGALLRNLTLPGFALIAIGASLNLVAIVANGGQMPADPAAVMALLGQASLPADVFSNSVVAGSGAAFPYLGDIMVLPRPIPFANVFSIGDVLIGIGGAYFLMRSMARRSSVSIPSARREHGAALLS
ncbi:MAG: DUF5317 domain-containing protein [Candidatus Limnocylindrales bacterium]